MAIASHIVITIEATASPSITYHKKVRNSTDSYVFS